VSRSAIEFQDFDIGNFRISVGDLLVFNGNICYILKMVVSDYHGKIHLTVNVPGIKQESKRLTFIIKKFLYQLEDRKIQLIPSKRNNV